MGDQRHEALVRDRWAEVSSVAVRHGDFRVEIHPGPREDCPTCARRDANAGPQERR